MKRIFDTKVQSLKYEVLKSVITRGFDGGLDTALLEIPKQIIPGPKSNMRCCIYKERAVLQERIRMAMGGDKSNPNIIEALTIACDECPVESYFVTQACRGCINHKCQDVCPASAITIVNKHAQIDEEKCKECGKCAKACPYHAIIENTRPCVSSCKIGAIKIDSDKTARIDNNKCVMCGACVYQCPFGALVDKSYVLDVVNLIKESLASRQSFDENPAQPGSPIRLYAVIAPAIVSQFKYAKIEQIVTGIKHLGFHQVVEAALGADITLHKELQEIQHVDKMTTSCCPSFVMYIQKHFPKLMQYISTSPSPMVEVARLIKATDSGAKVVFIGPCSSKKYEFQLPETLGAVDCVLSFEELQAFLDSRNVDVAALEESPLNNASFYGRIFAKSGGIAQGITELSAKDPLSKKITPLVCNGLEQCKMALLKMNVGRLAENFIEGMACDGGCLNGSLSLHHEDKNVTDVDKYGNFAKERDISASVELYNLTKDIEN